MKKHDKPQYTPQSSNAESGEELFVGRLEKIPATITLKGNPDPHNILLNGELLFDGHFVENGLFISILRTISIWSEPLDDLEGAVTMAGSGIGADSQSGQEGFIDPLDMRLYYALLSKEAESACVESDAVYPVLEMLRGRLEWHPYNNGEVASPAILLTMVFQLVETEAPLGLVESFEVKATALHLELMIPQLVEPQQHHSISQCGGGPLVNNPQDGRISHAQRTLRVRFICAELPPSNHTQALDEMDAVAQEQLNGACEVWWVKGGIKIALEQGIANVVEDSWLAQNDIVTGIPNNIVTGILKEADLPNHISNKSSTAVEVYLIEKLTGTSADPRRGGGVTHGCGTTNAFILLEIDKAKNNKYLLAHEIGHVLRIGHPSGVGGNVCAAIQAGSACSVSLPDRPTSPRNTENNLDITETYPAPLGPYFEIIANASCYWTPDPEQGFFHIIRDFPYDDGTEPSVPPAPPIVNWWTSSDVWNSHQGPLPGQNLDELYLDGTPMFNSDHTPIDSPVQSANNQMCVRLHVGEFISSKVEVHLFLAVPGISSANLVSLTGNNPLIFFHAGPSHLILPGIPHTQSVSWSISSGYPSHCSVFAVALSANAPDPALSNTVSNPQSNSFSLASLVELDNDVAQRSLNLQIVPSPPSNPGSISSTLVWLEMSNPFREAAPARLDIDTTQAQGLESLALEVDGENVSEITLGEQTSITLTDALRPENYMIIRLRATLLPSARPGISFPINLRFTVNDQFVGGYTHELRIKTLSETILQVLDLLYAAMRDVAIGCQADQAQALANKVKRIILRERIRADSSGCLGLLLRFLKPKSAWRSEVTNLSKATLALAQNLGTSSKREYQIVGRKVSELGALLDDSPNMEDANFIESIRDRADRIQEPAGRLARQRLRDGM